MKDDFRTLKSFEEEKYTPPFVYLGDVQFDDLDDTPLLVNPKK